MYCLTDMCYVCLEKKDKSLVNITSSLSVNKDIMHIISDLPFNLGWMKTKEIILICEECCRRLRETYQLLAMCLRNSTVMQGYMAKINISTADNEAELRVDLNNKHNDIHWIKCELKEEEEFESEPIIEETEIVFVNVDDSLAKEEDTWKREVVDDEEESPMDNHFTASSDNNMNTEIVVNSNTHDTDTASASSGSTSTQVHTTNNEELNAAAEKSHKCLTCSKSFRRKGQLQIHTRVHTGERPYECSVCKKCFTTKDALVKHMRIHSGERPYECSKCKRCFVCREYLVIHMRTHSDEKLFECASCKRCFRARSSLVYHMLVHTGERPYECSRCQKRFRNSSNLYAHLRRHNRSKNRNKK